MLKPGFILICLLLLPLAGCSTASRRAKTPAAADWSLVEKTNLRWDTDKLADVLKRNEYDELCPRKAEGEKLRKLLDSLEPERAKALRSCAKGSNSSALEIRAAAAVDATLN